MAKVSLQHVRCSVPPTTVLSQQLLRGSRDLPLLYVPTRYRKSESHDRRGGAINCSCAKSSLCAYPLPPLAPGKSQSLNPQFKGHSHKQRNRHLGRVTPDFDGFDTSEMFAANQKAPEEEERGGIQIGAESLPNLVPEDMDEITDEMRALQPPGTKDLDIRYMRQALRLAVQARGYTSPNPMVGCIIVKNGTVVGQGWHPKAGAPHAEVYALADARSDAQGATAYVTLEPCNHYGRTPPCTEALIRAKVKKVVIGCVDQNPLVGGKGVERLREEGIEVLVGVEGYACEELNLPFFYRTKYKRPYQMLRYALALNGKSHAEMVDSATREILHMFLVDFDATIINWKSLPNSGWDLQCGIEGACQPKRVVIGKSFGADDNLDWLTDEVAKHPAWNTSKSPMILALWHRKTSPQLEKLEEMGVEVRRFSPGVHVQDAIIPIMYDLGCCSIVWLGTPCEDVIEVQQIYAYAVPYYNLEGGLPAPQFKYTNSMVSQNHKDGWHFVPNTQLYLTPSSACLRGSSPGLLVEGPALLQGASAK